MPAARRRWRSRAAVRVARDEPQRTQPGLARRGRERAARARRRLRVRGRRQRHGGDARLAAGARRAGHRRDPVRRRARRGRRRVGLWQPEPAAGVHRRRAAGAAPARAAADRAAARRRRRRLARRRRAARGRRHRADELQPGRQLGLRQAAAGGAADRARRRRADRHGRPRPAPARAGARPGRDVQRDPDPDRRAGRRAAHARSSPSRSPASAPPRRRRRRRPRATRRRPRRRRAADAATTPPTPATTTTATTPPATPPPAAPAAVAVLATGERLYAPADSRMPIAPIDDGARTGVLLAPAAGDGSADTAVLHWDGADWTREQITPPDGVDDLHVLALAASSPSDAWLLAGSSRAGIPLLLFRRQLPSDGSTPTWERVTDPASPLLGPSASLPAGVTLTAAESGQPLTATARGVWVDGAVAADGVRHDLTFFVSTAGTVVDSWCAAPASFCSRPLEHDRSEREYRSVAWPGGDDDPLGTRLVGGYGEGKLLRLEGGRAELIFGAGRAVSANGAIAFSSPENGWVGGADASLSHVTSRPVGDALQPWPVPFRRPLLAVTSEPGVAAGAIGSGALAVGDGGQVARYVPGSGWRAEYLLDGNDERATPRLRAVAWPTPELAFAVGDDGAMWRWRSATGLWEADPGAPVDFDAHMMGVAFDPANPDRGYAVGKTGVLLRYEKSWERDTPPAGLEKAQFTSLAFAGAQAIATYRLSDPDDPSRSFGGIVVNDGGGWRIDTAFAQLLETVPGVKVVPRKVAGLPDGGAVVAGIGSGSVVIERDRPDAAWRFSSAPLAGARDIAAVAAVREGDRVRAVLSFEPTGQPTSTPSVVDAPITPPPPGAPPFLVQPDPLPAIGLLVRETANGWQDEQHAGFQMQRGDAPARPDAALALALAPAGDAGWVVGGETGTVVASGAERDQQTIQTAGAMRYPAEGQAPQGTQGAPIATAPDAVTFAVGGGSQCAAPCAALASSAIGPDRWLSAAVGKASGVGGVRAFLYTGGRLAPSVRTASPTARRPSCAATPRCSAAPPARCRCSLPRPTPRPTRAARRPTSRAAFGGFSIPFGSAPAPPGVEPQSSSPDAARTYYAFDSLAAGAARRPSASSCSTTARRRSTAGSSAGWRTACGTPTERRAGDRRRRPPAHGGGDGRRRRRRAGRGAARGRRHAAGVRGRRRGRRRRARVGVLLRRGRSQPRARAVGRRRDAADVGSGHARLRRVRRHARLRGLHRQRLPARVGRHDETDRSQPGGRVGAADPQHRRAGARRDRRDAAAAQRAGLVRRARAAAARRLQLHRQQRRRRPIPTSGSPADASAAAPAPSSPSTRSARRDRRSATSCGRIPTPPTRTPCCSAPTTSRSRTPRPASSARTTRARRRSRSEPAGSSTRSRCASSRAASDVPAARCRRTIRRRRSRTRSSSPAPPTRSRTRAPAATRRRAWSRRQRAAAPAGAAGQTPSPDRSRSRSRSGREPRSRCRRSSRRRSSSSCRTTASCRR